MDGGVGGDETGAGDDAAGSDDRYRTLVETVGDPMYVLDAEGTVETTNRAMARTLGYDDPDEVVGKHGTAFIPESDFERGTEVLLDLVADDDREWATFEMEVVTVDGRRLEMEDKVAALTDDEGNLVGSVGTARDVSDRKARQRALRERNADVSRLHAFTTALQGVETVREVYDLAIEAAVDILGLGWCVVAVARDGWFELVAVSEDAPVAVGERHLRVDEGMAGAVFQSGAARVVDDIRADDRHDPVDAAFRGALAVPVGDVGVFQAVSATPGAFGEAELELAELLAGHVQEAVERVERERELRELTGRIERLHGVARRLQSATEPGDVYDLVLDAAEGILAFDWSAVAVARDGWLELAAVSEDSPLERGGRHLRVDEGAAGAVYQSGEARLISVSAEDPDSDPVDDSFVSNVTVPLGDRGVFQANADEPDYFDEDDLELAELLAAHAGEALRRVDREAELREREAELRRQNDRLERFASVVSHDLRNPLTVAMGHLDAVDGPAAEEVRLSLDRMETIVEEVLELARQGRTIDDPEPVSLGEAVRSAWDNAETGDATLVVDGGRTLLADRNRLVELLGNLVRNAVEHAGDAPTLAVAPTDDGFHVSDDGPGVPPDERDRVFEMGYTTRSDGTGFGLAIVAEVAAAHGWTASVVEGDAGGARFEFAGVEWVDGP